MKTFFVALLLSVSILTSAQNLADEANKFINTLSPELKSKALFPLDTAERSDWTIVPRKRNGACLKDMTEPQREAAISLLRASLGAQGYKKAFDIMKNENILREVEGRTESDPYRDPVNYSVTFFGTPSKTTAWGWRLEGHHLSLNFFSNKGALTASTPSAMGSNPGIVLSGPHKGAELLKLETDLGFALVNSLSKTQLSEAVFSETALPEMLTLAKREAELLEPKGLPYSKLNDAQKKMFNDLLNVYVKNYQLGFSDKLMAKIKKAGTENLSFAWSGSLKPGAGHYYRIQGPMLLIEYDNTQNNANHVHTAVRDLQSDFGYDILKEHYLKEHN